MSEISFSIVTTTYNRAHLIHRVFDSLMAQTYKSFEWVVIDDGSTDATQSAINEFKARSFFDIKYIKTRNGGKANALNESVKYCEGLLYLVIDSDDWCDPNALEVFYDEYTSLIAIGKFDNDYLALSCLKKYKDGRVVGDDYSRIEKYGSTYIDRLNKRIKGDKWECLILSVLKGHRYPVAEGEKYMAPGYIWVTLASKGYKTVFINTALSIVEYQSEGISKNNLHHRINSVNSTIRYNAGFYGLQAISYRVGVRYYINYVRFSLHGRNSHRLSLKYSPFYIVGGLLYLSDVLKKRLCK